MPLNAITVIIEEEPELIEISPEELQMILKAREKQRKKVRQAELVAELNDLLAKIKEEGFTVSTGNVNTFQKAAPWGDADGSWIRVY